MGSSVPGFVWLAAASACAMLRAAPARAQVPENPSGTGSLAAPSATSVTSASVQPARRPEEDFSERASPWVDLSFFSFAFDQRASEFMNLGAQVGGYFWDHLRLSATLIAPLDRVSDTRISYSSGPATGSGSYNTVRSRDISVLYGVSGGFAISNSRSFVFGPSLSLIRTDVEDYGSTVLFMLPFEWTTQRNLRVGFGLGLGRSIGGHARQICISGNVSCGSRNVERPSSTAVMAQFQMGWALGSL